MKSTYGKTKIVIVEDNETLRQGFEFLISSHEKYLVKSKYENAELAIKNLRKDMPGIILMDIELPGMSGIEAIRIIKKTIPAIQIVVLSVHDDSQLVFEALCAGASGYLTKNAKMEKILNALDEILEGGAPMSSRIAKMVVSSFNRNHNSPLTTREMEVLQLLTDGKSYSRIAEELFVQKETVRTHLKNIYTKLHVNSKAEAILKAKSERYI